jgi:hypothetical protein
VDHQPPGAVCPHLIQDVALLKAGSGYVVECHRCLAPLGFVSTPRAFQSLRREVLASAAFSTAGPTGRWD